jgi:hypothetical protein
MALAPRSASAIAGSAMSTPKTHHHEARRRCADASGSIEGNCPQNMAANRQDSVKVGLVDPGHESRFLSRSTSAGTLDAAAA